MENALSIFQHFWQDVALKYSLISAIVWDCVHTKEKDYKKKVYIYINSYKTDSKAP